MPRIFFFDGGESFPTKILNQDDEFIVVQSPARSAAPPWIFSRATGNLVAGFTGAPGAKAQGYHVDHDVVLVLG